MDVDTKKQETTQVPIPDPLRNTVLFLSIVGIALIIGFAAFCFIRYDGSNQVAIFLSGILVGIYCFAKGRRIRNKWYKGIIKEQVFQCVSCKKRYPLSVTSVTRRSYNAYYLLVCMEVNGDGEAIQNKLHEFTIRKGGENVNPGQVVILYIDQTNPKDPVAWKVL